MPDGEGVNEVEYFLEEGEEAGRNVVLVCILLKLICDLDVIDGRESRPETSLLPRLALI